MNNKIVLVTGANGQLGQELIHSLLSKYEVIGLTKEELDVTQLVECEKKIEEIKPHIVIHCAAYTAVDQAESDSEQAFLVNEQGTKNIAQVTEKLGIKLIYISTDYVFDGQANQPYEVFDPPHPKTVYGASKLAGEKAVIENHTKYFIVRTAWVFGAYGKNFVKTMLELATKNKSLMVVDDQIGSPTYTYDLALALSQLMETEKYGYYHITNTGQCSWFEFARTIFNCAEIEIEVIPCTSEQFIRPAPRPHYSVLSQKAWEENSFKLLRPWEEAVAHYMKQSCFRKEE